MLLLQTYYMHLSKERRYLLNSTMIREITKRERENYKRIQAEKTATGAAETAALHIPTGKGTTMTFYSSGTNPFYHYWTMDKDRGEWLPQKFDKDVANATLVKFVYFQQNSSTRWIHSIAQCNKQHA